jgi:hypothetical protein
MIKKSAADMSKIRQLGNRNLGSLAFCNHRSRTLVRLGIIHALVVVCYLSACSGGGVLFMGNSGSGPEGTGRMPFYFGTSCSPLHV